MKALLFLPVKKRFLPKWEYYQVDFDMLSEFFPNTIVCTSIWEVVRHCWGANLIYCWWWHTSLHIVILSKILRIKTLVTGAIHMFDLSGGPDFYNKSILYRLFTRLSLALADHNLFISYDQFLQVTSHLYVKNPIVIRSSLPKEYKFTCSDIISNRQNIREKDNIDNNVTRFLTVSWQKLISYKRKGVFETLSALALLKEQNNFKFEWYIIGEKDDGVDFLKLKIKELELANHVFVITNVTPEEKKNFYMKSDLYIQPSWCEGFGNAVLEAMSYGLPALVSRYTAQPEVVGDSGFIIIEIEAQSILKVLYRFLNMNCVEKEQVENNTIDRVYKNFTFSKRVFEFKKILTNAKIIP